VSQTNLGQFPGTKDGSTRIDMEGVRKCPQCEKWAFKPTNIGRSRWKCGKCSYVLISVTYKRKVKEYIPVGVVDEELVEESSRQKERSLEVQKMRMER